jgi:hypothetical protein
MSFVYVMVHSSGLRFKVGKSKVPLRRSEKFEGVDLIQSWEMEVGKENALGVERGLQALLGIRFKHPQIDEDGGTEWFHIAGLAHALSHLRGQEELLQARLVKIPLPPITELPSEDARMLRRAAIRERNKRLSEERLRKENTNEIARFSRLKNWLNQQGASFSTEQGGEILAISLHVSSKEEWAQIDQNRLLAFRIKIRKGTTYRLHCNDPVSEYSPVEKTALFRLNTRMWQSDNFESPLSFTDMLARVDTTCRGRLRAAQDWIARTSNRRTQSVSERDARDCLPS